MWTDRTRLHECIDQILIQVVAARAVIEHVPSGSIVFRVEVRPQKHRPYLPCLFRRTQR